MPYIESANRGGLEHAGKMPASAGELAFVEVDLWRRFVGKKPNFFDFAIVFGATALALAEFWWRVVRPYEDGKMKENGDVF